MDQTIARIAEQLGLQAARVWPQVVMVTWITSLFWSIVDPIIFIGCGVGIVVAAKWAIRYVNACRDAYDEAKQQSGNRYVSDSDYDPTMIVLVVCMGCALLLVAAVIALVAWPDALSGALYPEAATVIRIARGLK